MANGRRSASEPPDFKISCATAACIARSLLKGASVWAGLSFTLNLVWEVVQLPLYTIAEGGTAARLPVDLCYG